MGKLFTAKVGKLLTRILGNYLTEALGKVLDIYTGLRFVPKSIEEKFSYGLVVAGKIPSRHKINMEGFKRDLEGIGFEIVAEINLHLLLFVFSWFIKVFPKIEKVVSRKLLTKLLKVEKAMLNRSFSKKMSSMFILQCVKTKG